MAKFKFKLQSYLNVKEKIEEQKKLEYGKALQKLESEKQKKVLLTKMSYEALLDMRENMNSGILPHELIRYKQYITQLEKDIIKQEGVIKLAENFAESKRIELLGAVKQRKMLEKLKENAYEAYLEEESRAEQKIVDEIVSYKYNNNGL